MSSLLSSGNLPLTSNFCSDYISEASFPAKNEMLALLFPLATSPIAVRLPIHLLEYTHENSCFQISSSETCISYPAERGETPRRWPGTCHREIHYLCPDIVSAACVLTFGLKNAFGVAVPPAVPIRDISSQAYMPVHPGGPTPEEISYQQVTPMFSEIDKSHSLLPSRSMMHDAHFRRFLRGPSQRSAYTPGELTGRWEGVFLVR